MSFTRATQQTMSWLRGTRQGDQENKKKTSWFMDHSLTESRIILEGSTGDLGKQSILFKILQVNNMPQKFLDQL
jgi:hypothetical protein